MGENQVNIFKGLHTRGTRLLVLSGPVGSGKSTLGKGLAERFGVAVVRTQDLMADAAARLGEVVQPERRALQEFGDRLDRETNESWVATGVAELLASGQIDGELVIIDAVRTLGQVESLRRGFPARVTHVHVHAPNEVLHDRYMDRADSGILELESYEQVADNRTEAKVMTLGHDADVSIDTSRSSARDVQARAAAALGMNASRKERLVDVFIGGQYGSEGKGNIAYHLASEYDVLVRVGGPNAGHKVPTDPVYTHRLLPSGTMGNPNALLLIGPGATVSIDLLLSEIADCQVEVGRLFIDPNCMTIEDADIEAEQRLVESIGSTGRGGGAAAARRIMGRHRGAAPPVRLARDVPELAPFIGSTSEILETAFRDRKSVMLEGTQGTLLSLYHGFYPWVTSRDTTTAGCLAESGIGPHRVRRVVMVVRTYPIRVGNPPEGSSGQMSQEIDWDVVASRSGLDEADLRRKEEGSVSGTKRRVAEFDWDLLRRAAELNGATDFALTFADYIDSSNLNARRFDQLTPETIDFIEEVSRVGGAPVSLITTGFDNRSLIDRREW